MHKTTFEHRYKIGQQVWRVNAFHDRKPYEVEIYDIIFSNSGALYVTRFGSFIEHKLFLTEAIALKQYESWGCAKNH